MTAARTRGRTAAGLSGVIVAASAFGITALDHASRPVRRTPTPATRTNHVERDLEPTVRCGRQRWAVKTATDPAAASIDLQTVKSTTIARLSSLPRPANTGTRTAPVETTIYSVRATLTTYLREDDSDYHLVLEDTRGNTMIAEMPSPDCAVGSRLRREITAVRGAFDRKFAVSGSAKSVSQRVTVTGVGFFDFVHTQTGVADNAIELHPVTEIHFG